MIAAQDLRIDNWLIFDGRYFQIDCIAKDAPFLNTEEFGVGVVSYKNIMPINLSHKILEKCGFKNDHSTFEYADGSNNEKLFILWIDGEYVVELQNGEKNIFIELKYLHQLQNLYYCLVGQELQVKL